MSFSEEFLARIDRQAKRTTRFIGLDSMHDLSLEGLVKIAGVHRHSFCLAGFAGNDSQQPPGELQKLCWNNLE